MKWSRNGEDTGGDAIVLSFPSGIQARLDLQGPPEREDAPQGPVEAKGRSRTPTPAPAPEAQVEPSGLSPANARALVAWHMAGLSLFASGRQPSLRDATAHARAVLLALEMERKEGNITHLASALGTSRRAAREHLRRVGLYDWKQLDDDDDDDDDDEQQHHHEGPAANVE